MPAINPDRLLRDLRELRSIGASGIGVIRPALSPADMQARRWLAGRYEAAGLEASIDGVGNVFGRSPNPGKALLIGSHSDTQPTGGWLDGALGVIYGLEVVRALTEDPRTRDLPVDAVSWQDEESRFHGCLGSRSFCRLLPPDQDADPTDGLALAASMDIHDRDGVAMADAIREADLGGVPRARVDAERYLGFVEAHIEQGPQLESEGLKIGVVTSIVGLGGRVFTFHGQQNHAGTTMMATRKDASRALYDLAHSINQGFEAAAGERTVWTMGRAVLSPGAASIVPGYAELELQYRDPSVAVLDRLEAVLGEIVTDVAARNAASIESKPARPRIAPTDMDASLQEHIARAAEQHAPGAWTRMPSGAFHDAGIVSAVLPSAMLFIPSIGGISHDFAEDSHEDDIVLGCRVLADAAATMLA